MVADREIRITHPDKPSFTAGIELSKLVIVRYYLAVAPGARAGIAGRPLMLKRFVDGAERPPFYQGRAPAQRPAWVRTVALTFPSGREAEEVLVDDEAGLAWIVNLGCLELHPLAVRSGDLALDTRAPERGAAPPGERRPRRFDARPLVDLDARPRASPARPGELRPRQERPDPDDDPTRRGTRRSRGA
jgi:DNA primase